MICHLLQCFVCFAVGGANLPTAVSEFIMSNEDLHQKVLEYEPIWIEQLQGDLRNNGLKFKMQDLMTFLDEKVSWQKSPRLLM